MKKLLLILFCAGLLLLGLGLGQTALALPDCPRPNQCLAFDVCTTGSNEQYDCGDPGLVCCEATSGTCISTHQGYSCIEPGSRTDCKSDLCPGNQKCCPPKCALASCRAACDGTFVEDTSKSATGCTETGKTKCCKVGDAGGNEGDSGNPGTTEGATIPLAPLSPVGDVDVPTLIGYIIKGALGIVGSIALLMFVYGGFLMLVSQGDAAKVKKGKDALIWATAGLAVIFGSYIFVGYILSGLSGGGGGGDTGTAVDACGSAYPGHSCMNKNNGTDCKTNKCPGTGPEILCCVAK